MQSIMRRSQLKEVSQLINLYNEVTLHLHSKGIMQWSVPWDSIRIIGDIEKGNLYSVIMGNHIVGAFVINKLLTYEPIEFTGESLYLGQIAILPKFQGMGIGREVIRYACNLASTANSALYLDCWAGNNKLKQFYHEAGFHYVGDFPEEDYMISVFKFEP